MGTACHHGNPGQGQEQAGRKGGGTAGRHDKPRRDRGPAGKGCHKAPARSGAPDCPALCDAGGLLYQFSPLVSLAAIYTVP